MVGLIQHQEEKNNKKEKGSENFLFLCEKKDEIKMFEW